MTDRELMQQALEAAYLAGFNDSAEGYNGEYPFRDYGGTPIKDRLWVGRRHEYIRSALAEQPAQQQEPVAWYDAEKDCAYTLADCEGRAQDDLEPLYLAQSSKPWVGLTAEEIERVCVPLGAAMLSFTEVARAIEAKLREKNTGETK